MRRSCTHRLRPGSAPSSSRRRTLLCAHARSTSGAQEVEELEGLLQEREELDYITLRCDLEALSTHETCLNRREADLEREQKALEDTRA
jgi:hypothetical protein